MNPEDGPNGNEYLTPGEEHAYTTGYNVGYEEGYAQGYGEGQDDC